MGRIDQGGIKSAREFCSRRLLHPKSWHGDKEKKKNKSSTETASWEAKGRHHPRGTNTNTSVCERCDRRKEGRSLYASLALVVVVVVVVVYFKAVCMYSIHLVSKQVNGFRLRFSFLQQARERRRKSVLRTFASIHAHAHNNHPPILDMYKKAWPCFAPARYLIRKLYSFPRRLFSSRSTSFSVFSPLAVCLACVSTRAIKTSYLRQVVPRH